MSNYSMRSRFLTLCLAGSVLGAVGLATPAMAQQLEGLEIIAASTAGSGNDQAARAIAETLEAEGLASGVQVVNVPGAGGTVGLAQLAGNQKETPSMMIVSVTVVASTILNDSPVTLADVEPVAMISAETNTIVVPADSEIQTLQDLLDKLKTDPGSVSIGVGSPGGLDHIMAARVGEAAGVDLSQLNVVNFSGGGDQQAAVLGGHVDVGIAGLNEFRQLIDTGRLRSLGISTAERLPGVDIPTLKEQGVDVEVTAWKGLIMRESASDEEKQLLRQSVEQAVKSEDWQQTLEQFSWFPFYKNAEESAAFLAQEQEELAGDLKALGLIE